MNVRKSLIYSCILLFLINTGCDKQIHTLETVSPDSTIQVKVIVEKGKVFYTVCKQHKPVINKSFLGFKFSNMPDLDHDFIISGVEKNNYDQTWEQPWGEEKFIRNNYNELIVHLKEKSSLHRNLDLIFRIFNDGVGFRYNIPEQPQVDSIILMDEETEFNLTGNHKAWWIPVHSETSFYESLYRHTAISSIDTANTPLTIEADSNLFLAIHEANLTDYASMTLQRKDSSLLKCELVPWSNGVKVYGKTPFVTPWRTIIIATKAEALITSHLMLNLNEPCKLENISWIKPMKYIGIWWNLHMGDNTWEQGPNHGATTKNTMQYIDFASKNGFGGVLAEGWNVGWGMNETCSFTKPYPDFDIEKVCNHAASKNIQLIGHNETHGAATDFENQMEHAFEMYSKLGMHVVKTGYVGKYLDGKEWHDGQYGVRHYRKVIETAAKYQLMIDCHEPIKPTGLSRTYPNLMTQEGARGQEYDAWSTDGGNPPSHTTIIPFTRMLAGPLDFTPGTFNFNNPLHQGTRVQTTLAKQLALFVVLYSPLQMASDCPNNYNNNPAFGFIKKVPCDWQCTKVLNAKIGNYLTIVRKDRNSENWYLGSITNENVRELTIRLSFLDPEKKYQAVIYADNDDANWNSNPFAVSITSNKVTSADFIVIKLAAGGGQAISFTPVSE